MFAFCASERTIFFSLFDAGKEKLHTDGTGEKLMTRNKQIENAERTHPFCEVNQVMRTNLYVCAVYAFAYKQHV